MHQQQRQPCRAYRLMARATACFAISLAVAATSKAENGQIGHAFPMENITIDGQLNDWPETAIVHGIKSAVFGPLPEPDDCTASFRAGYSVKEQALYVALERQDESHRALPNAPDDWLVQDSYWLYLDPVHSERGSGPIFFGWAGDERGRSAGDAEWSGTGQDHWKTVELGYTNRDGKVVLEWKILLGAAIQPGRTMGFDVMVLDMDAEDSDIEGSIVSWGSTGGKSLGAHRLGDLILAKPEDTTGRICGQVKWADEFAADDAPKLGALHVTSTENADWRLTIPIDPESGTYEATVPSGDYVLSPITPYMGGPDSFWRLKPGLKVAVQVESGELTQAGVLELARQPEPNLTAAPSLLFDYSDQDEVVVDRFVTALMDYYAIPGASIALISKGEIVYSKPFGVKDLYTQEPVTPNTMFEAASITKIVFAFAANRLAERGVFDLDRPLHEYLSFEAIAHDDRYKRITARHCLAHVTGFPNWAYDNDDGVLDIKADPGSTYGYSGEGIQYLGRVVAKLYGKPLEQLVIQETCEPMGFAEHCYFSDSTRLRNNLAHGHIGPSVQAFDIPEDIGVAHSMYTSAEGLATFMVSLIAQRGMSAEGYRKMLTVETKIPAEDSIGDWPSAFGLGFNIQESDWGRAIGHGGNNGDFQCMFQYFEDHDAGYVVLTNSNMGGAFHRKLRDFLTRGAAGKAAAQE